VASHCQAISSQREVVSYLKANGMSAFATNFTITSNGAHPDVKGTGFMPYYLVFDHTGKLVAHHMSGSYHGGDGNRFIEIVDELLKTAPEIYLGPEPFTKIESLAQQVMKGKGLGTAMKKVDTTATAEADPETKAELERLGAVLTRYRDRKLAKALALEGGQPAGVLPALKGLAADFKGSSLAPDVEKNLEEMTASEALKTQIGMEKKFLAIQKKFEKTKDKMRTDAFIDSTVSKLQKLLEGNEALPFAATIEAFLAELR
jgi:hypothetical protein